MKNYKIEIFKKMSQLENSATPPLDLSTKTLSEIAGIVRRDWKNIFFGAKPYLDAMSSLDDIKQMYGMDTGKSIVAYFLSNAATYRGEVAKAVKMELNRRLKSK